MKQTVSKVLSGLGVPLLWNSRPEISKTNHTAICYQFYSETDKLFGDGKGHEEGGTVLVDVFSLKDYSAVVASVKSLMKAAGFRLADSRDDDDTLGNIKCYHKILIFNYIESEVKRNVQD